MGMHTELIFGAKLKKDTPNEVVEALKYMLGETEAKPTSFPLPDGRCEWNLGGVILSKSYQNVNITNLLQKMV